METAIAHVRKAAATVVAVLYAWHATANLLTDFYNVPVLRVRTKHWADHKCTADPGSSYHTYTTRQLQR